MTFSIFSTPRVRTIAAITALTTCLTSGFAKTIDWKIVGSWDITIIWRIAPRI